MNRYRIIFFECIIFFFSGCHSSQKLSPHLIFTDTDNWVRTQHDSLHIKTFRSEDLSKRSNLIIVIHGDAPFNNPGYQYALAKIISTENKNTIAIGLLRPGYTDPENIHSPGTKGLTTGDNYTAEVVDDIAAAIRNLKNLYHPINTIIAGHSGGSAITADIVSRYPAIADAAVIVSCPCNVPAWRAHMKAMQNDSIWDKPVNSLSPHDLINGIDKKTKLIIITGEKDEVAPTELSNQYYNQLKKNNLDAELITIKDADHEIFLTDSVRKAIAKLML
jgi:pimeloyl-ACP methyl ester carboxylesterase